MTEAVREMTRGRKVVSGGRCTFYTLVVVDVTFLYFLDSTCSMLLQVRVKGATDPDFSVVSYNILADCHMKSDWYQLFIDGQ